MNLIEFARHFQLNEMEKQAYVLSRVNFKLLSIIVLITNIYVHAFLLTCKCSNDQNELPSQRTLQREVRKNNYPCLYNSLSDVSVALDHVVIGS